MSRVLLTFPDSYVQGMAQKCNVLIIIILPLSTKFETVLKLKLQFKIPDDPQSSSYERHHWNGTRVCAS